MYIPYTVLPCLICSCTHAHDGNNQFVDLPVRLGVSVHALSLTDLFGIPQ